MLPPGLAFSTFIGAQPLRGPQGIHTPGSVYAISIKGSITASPKNIPISQRFCLAAVQAGGPPYIGVSQQLTAAQMLALLTGFVTAAPGTTMFYLAMQRLWTSLSVYRANIKELTYPLTPQANYTTAIPGGYSTGRQVPAQLALLVSQGTGLSGKNWNSRTHFGPLATGDVAGSSLSAGGVTAWNTIAAAATASLTIGGVVYLPVLVNGIGLRPRNDISHYDPRERRWVPELPSWVEEYNLAVGRPIDAPVSQEEVENAITWAPITSVTTLSTNTALSQLRNRKPANRRSFSRPGKRIARLFVERQAVQRLRAKEPRHNLLPGDGVENRLGLPAGRPAAPEARRIEHQVERAVERDIEDGRFPRDPESDE